MTNTGNAAKTISYVKAPKINYTKPAKPSGSIRLEANQEVWLTGPRTGRLVTNDRG